MPDDGGRTWTGRARLGAAHQQDDRGGMTWSRTGRPCGTGSAPPCGR
ncbi:hypothetical protein [Ornithinimicrobium kibberense]